MIGAGILGGPGIGYKQDYFAVDRLQSTTDGQETYQRYMAKNDKGEPEKTGFPLVSSVAPDKVPPVAGIDNAKYKVFEDHLAHVGGANPPRLPAPGAASARRPRRGPADRRPGVRGAAGRALRRSGGGPCRGTLPRPEGARRRHPPPRAGATPGGTPGVPGESRARHRYNSPHGG